MDPPSRVPCPTQPNPHRGACSSLTSATCALVTLLHATCVALGPTRPAHASGLPTNEVRAAMVYASLCPGPSRPRQPTCATLRLDPCALVFEVASKNFFRRDWISCRGLVVGFLCRRTQVEIWSWGGGAVGRAEIIAVSVNPFQYFQMEMFLRLMKTSSLQKTKGRSRGLASHQPAARASQQRTSVES